MKVLEGYHSVPVLFISKEDCCGCSACYSICPMKAIYMKEDECGFEYPYINGELCVSCYKCMKICPIKIVDNQK